ncbi:hexosaminidase [Entomortierella parvispora]|uniref:Beta-hexosaminidase n=1 Tax=Entomortierella parvispora TaxID=205924 RepID=A0A9P3LWC7_9FUNG|nr:hexosaminidase [Entomortierella parvispora]
MTKVMYSISAALALASNAFLVSLLFMPDPAPVQSHLWPKPASTCQGHRTIQLSKHFKFRLPDDVHPRLAAGAARLRNRIRSSDFQSPVPVDPSLLAKEDRSEVESLELKTIRVEVEESISNEPLSLETDESYRILIGVDEEDPNTPFEIDEDLCKHILKSATPIAGVQGTIHAKTMYGALRAMETFSQLVVNNQEDGTKEIPRTPIVIHDRPLFAHRGLLVDSSRNFLSMSALYKTLDAMVMNKLNVLHWHIADSQSFPIALDDQPSEELDDGEEIPGLPLSELAAKGAYSSSMVYSKRDIAKIVDYAMDRGIRVIPEIDMPGHAWSWSQAFPEITTCLDGYPSYSRFAAEPPSGQLNPVLPKTYEVLRGVYDQVVPLFKDRNFHAGADEVNINCWNTTESIVNLMEKKNIPRTEAGFDQILDNFVSNQHAMLRDGGKQPIVWEEPLLGHNLKTLADNKDVVIQVWTSSQNIKKAIKKGYKVIAGSADYWYLDCGYGDWLGNWTLGTSWCDYKGWQKIYSFNPLTGLSSNEAKSVIGGEALLWGEQVDETNLDTKLWPRASAAAEVLWSGNSEDSKTKLWNGPDQHDDTLRSIEALDRLNEHRFRMVSENIRAEPLQPLWCVRHPGHCLWPIYDTKPKDQAY